MTIENLYNMSNTTTTADKSLNMMSLFDYLGKPAGGQLGKRVAEEASKQKIPMSEIGRAHRLNSSHTDISRMPSSA